MLISPSEVFFKIAGSARKKRLSLNLSQQSLSKSSGVSYAVIKKFESTGKISLESLLKIAMVLGSLNEFTDLFKINNSEIESNYIDMIIEFREPFGSIDKYVFWNKKKELKFWQDKV